MSGPLHAAVEHLYVTFAGYRLPLVASACEHCAELVEPDGLADRPPRTLPAAALEHLAMKVATTWGGADELRALLPRLCELAAAGDPHVPLRVVMAKLRHGGWLGWPLPEQQAVADFLGALWSEVLDTPTGHHDAGGVLLATGEAIDDLHPFLASWHERASDESDTPVRRHAMTHLIRFVLGYQNELRRGRLPDQVAVWLRGPTTHIQLDRAVYDFAGTPLGNDARMATAVLALAPPAATDPE